ncbi:hypothetical protein B0T24DRAFT_598129 [Lasiosphaeria ovina]|uniref:Uncharacterized protein n=1 Tax=Lasiosphaeria ovina TaxID=92902 RepID=A0AAE0MZ40_9PEZI|nr:hypothetical protein B0T24DRAFT_598129 [Lasiosphaeria ovina]
MHFSTYGVPTLGVRIRIALLVQELSSVGAADLIADDESKDSAEVVILGFARLLVGKEDEATWLCFYMSTDFHLVSSQDVLELVAILRTASSLLDPKSSKARDPDDSFLPPATTFLEASQTKLFEPPRMIHFQASADVHPHVIHWQRKSFHPRIVSSKVRNAPNDCRCASLMWAENGHLLITCVTLWVVGVSIITTERTCIWCRSSRLGEKLGNHAGVEAILEQSFRVRWGRKGEGWLYSMLDMDGWSNIPALHSSPRRPTDECPFGRHDSQ